MTSPRRDERLIVALDVPTLDEALALQAKLGGVVTRFKVGLELFVTEGPRAVEAIRARGGRVFLDLKLHDIPETVRRAARCAAATGAELITVHTAGGPAMLAAAVEGARQGGDAAVLGVTVLTSLDAQQLAEVNTAPQSLPDLVVKRAQAARQAGCAGIIASPKEVAVIRAVIGPDLLVITPGVRPKGASTDDQKRTASAAEAIAAGANAIVVGRPIRDAQDPRAAAQSLLDELACCDAE